MTPKPIHRSTFVPSSPSGRRILRIAAGLGAAALVAGVGLFACGLGDDDLQDEAARTAASAQAQQGSSRPGGTAGQPGQAGSKEAEAVAAPPRYDATTCWRDLKRFNEGVTIENFREWAAPLVASRDPLVRDYLKERLTELIGNDPARAMEVMGWARDADGKTFGMYLTALRGSEAIQLPEVAAKLMKLGLDGKIAPERRAGFLSALDTQKRLEPAALDRLTSFAKDPTSGEAGWAATRTLARVMKRDFEQSGTVKPYLNKLITIGTESPDEQIRYLAQSMPMHAAPVLDAEATERYAKILATEGNEDGRDAAAHNLSLSQDRTKVLELFAKTFETEQAVCVRWALFRFSARMAGKDALPVMAKMAIIDPRFQANYRNFEQIYASGTLDWVRVWNSLPNQDPYGCLDRHE